MHFQRRAARGGEARPLHARRDLGRRSSTCGPSRRRTCAWIRRRAHGRQPPAALRARRASRTASRRSCPTPRPSTRSAQFYTPEHEARRPLGRPGVRRSSGRTCRRARCPTRIAAGPTTGPHGYPRDHRRPGAASGGEREGDPIRVGLVGAGFMGRGIALQIAHGDPGMELVAIANRTLEPARCRPTREAGVGDAEHVARRWPSSSRRSPPAAPAVTEDALLRRRGRGHRRDRRGHRRRRARRRTSRCDAIEHGKHVILMNAELDGTRRADPARSAPTGPASSSRTPTATSPA